MLKKLDKETKEKEIRAWIRGLEVMKRVEVMQPYFPKFSVIDMPLLMLFEDMTFERKLEMYEKAKEGKK